MNNLLDPIPTWVIMLATLAILVGVSEVGNRLARAKGTASEGKNPAVLIETTAFTLLALLLGFSFSLSLGRYDARRGTLLREANSISTTFLRTDVLDPQTAAAMRADLRAYVGRRLEFAQADAAPAQRAAAEDASTKLQRSMWSSAMLVAKRDDRSTMVPLFIAALNTTIELSKEERAVLTNHIPDVVIVWLLLVGIVAAAMLGYAFGRQDMRALGFRTVFAFMIALVFGLVLDLDRPQRGIIRVSLAPLQTLQQSMSEP